MTTTTASPPRRFRFRLGTAFLLVVIVALGVAQVSSTLRVRQFETRNRFLETENAKLRIEAGYLEVVDPSKVAVLQLRDLDELSWRWKVYLPKGRWTMHATTHDVPLSGVTQATNRASVGGGQVLNVAASVRKGADGSWQLYTRFEGAEGRSSLGEKHRLVAGEHRGFTTQAAGNGDVQVFDPRKRIELLRVRTQEPVANGPGSWTSVDSKEPVDGILIWIDRAK
ncbi:MAG: hypothetical protein AB7O59_07080 [Pirellulales bacterium]